MKGVYSYRTSCPRACQGSLKQTIVSNEQNRPFQRLKTRKNKAKLCAYVHTCLCLLCVCVTLADIVHHKLCHFIQAFRPRLDSGGSQIFVIKRFLHDTNHALLVPKEQSCLLGLHCVIRESLLCPGLYNQRVSSVCSQLISQSPRGSAFSVSASVYRLYVLRCFCYTFI